MYLKYFFTFVFLSSINLSFASSSWVKPIDGTATMDKLDFWTGYSFFKAPWVIAPASTVARDGLGPNFNARSCDACHLNGASGNHKDQALGFVVRIGDEKKHQNVFDDYGQQLQVYSIGSASGSEQVKTEVKIKIEWKQALVDTNSGKVELQYPDIQLSDFAYKPVDHSVPLSLRIAPPLFGLGLLDLVKDEELLKLQDKNDQDKDGVFGRVNYVWSIEHNTKKIGRFGHKSEQPTLLQQIAGAFNADIGITSWLFPDQDCPKNQISCQKAPSGNSGKENIEIPRSKLNLVAKFSRLLRAANEVKEVHPLFVKAQCAKCHQPALPLPKENEFKLDKVWAYSNLLLHDMGKGLSDNRSYNGVLPQEWRTTPLWGISRKLKQSPVSLLHDGRARSIKEAIYWHGGEAERSKQAFENLSEIEQQNIIKFVSSL